MTTETPDADALAALLASATPGLDDFGPDVRETCAACKCLLMPPDAVSRCEDCHPDDEQADAWRDALEAAEKRDAALRNAAPTLIAALRERDGLREGVARVRRWADEADAKHATTGATQDQGSRDALRVVVDMFERAEKRAMAAEGRAR